MNTRIAVGILILLLVLFVYILSPYFYPEEIAFFYLLPYVLFVVPIGLYVAIKILLRKKESIRSFFFKLAVPSSIIHVLILFFVISVAYPRYIQKEDAIADLGYMVKTMEDVHPNLYEYASKEEFYRDIETLKRSLPEKISVKEFLKDLCGLTAELHDGHTGPGLENLATTGIAFEKGFFPTRPGSWATGYS